MRATFARNDGSAGSFGFSSRGLLAMNIDDEADRADQNSRPSTRYLVLNKGRHSPGNSSFLGGFPPACHRRDPAQRPLVTRVDRAPPWSVGSSPGALRRRGPTSSVSAHPPDRSGGAGGRHLPGASRPGLPRATVRHRDEPQLEPQPSEAEHRGCRRDRLAASEEPPRSCPGVEARIRAKWWQGR